MAGSTTVAVNWTCGRCGLVVPANTPHVCPPTANQINVWPCFGTVHDYAVGPTHAVCNRCSKVVKLDA